MTSPIPERESVSESYQLITDPIERAQREASNAVEQYDRVLDLIDTAVRDGYPFRLRPSMILTLHRVAMAGIHAQAGTFRNTPVRIEGSEHKTPAEHLVPSLMEEMCDWLERNWPTTSAITLCAYVMWRLNWIHPFADGNGRTSRAVSYLVLCVRSGDRLPGRITIPEQIAQNKTPYYDALEKLDTQDDFNAPDLRAMEELLEACLAQQLKTVFDAATKAEIDARLPRKFH